MRKNFNPKYKFYTNDKKVIAVSTYAKKNVRGVAVCSKDDNFDVDFGMKLAKIRCDKRINEKRLKYLNNKVKDVNTIIDYFISERSKMINIINETYDTITNLNQEENDLLNV